MHVLYQIKHREACTKNPKQFSNHRHKTTALTVQHLLEHCNSSFPETDLSQATQRVGPDGETGTNWCPLVLPDLSFPSFISFVFTCKNCKYFKFTLSFYTVKTRIPHKPPTDNTIRSSKASRGIEQSCSC